MSSETCLSPPKRILDPTRWDGSSEVTPANQRSWSSRLGGYRVSNCGPSSLHAVEHFCPRRTEVTRSGFLMFDLVVGIVRSVSAALVRLELSCH